MNSALLAIQPPQELPGREDRQVRREREQVAIARDEDRFIFLRQCDQVIVAGVWRDPGWTIDVVTKNAAASDETDEGLRVFFPDPLSQLRVGKRAGQLVDHLR